jgi:hypothetical protein
LTFLLFFIRYSRFDKAFLLAVDIGARDLFMVRNIFTLPKLLSCGYLIYRFAAAVNLLQDIHYMALDKGETALAEVAKRKAEQVETESIGKSKSLICHEKSVIGPKLYTGYPFKTSYQWYGKT